MSVKVGVRVRPFNQREKDLNSSLCVDMIGPMTRLFHPETQEKPRDFTFDYSFWSHDQFHPDQNDYFVPDGDKYADQRHVFQQVGLQILSNAWEGYHCCLFAYGQTGAGKSYSMVGYGANKGIVPISCQQIFNRIAANDNKSKQYQVNISMLQIYNQRVQDLLIPINTRSKQGLKIREHKTLGVYVQGLSKHYVDSYQSIEAKMDEGSKHRSIAATQMNASSSRAHTIISIQFRQIDIIENKKKEKLSVIYLVDLAGSQKVGKTGATGDRLKQAAGINKSLSVLGLVISTLADKSMGKGKNIIVPYRDSCLTRILQNALGGNSKTLMICAISPATDNYEQTLSTLRYADQAKKIQNKAVINESQTDKVIRNLKAQKQQLQSKLQKFEEMFKKFGLGMNVDQGMVDQFNDAKQQLKFNNRMINDYQMTKTQKLQIEKQQAEVTRIDLNKPHISNLNEDPQLSRKINYSIDKSMITIGKRGSEITNDIQIGGMGIRPQHARIIVAEQNNKVILQPVCQSQDTGVYLNGNPVTMKQQLRNFDRVAFGTNNIFIVMIPNTQPRDNSIIESNLDWQFAQNELYLRKQIKEQEQITEKQRKIKQQAESILRQKQKQLLQLQRHLQQSQELRKNIEQQNERQKAQILQKLKRQQAQRLQRQIDDDKKKMQDTETEQKNKIKEKYYFQENLLKALPKCIQLNLIAKEFKRNVVMNVRMLLGDEDQFSDNSTNKKTIKVKVTNREVGYNYWWDIEKLSNRYYIIKDMSQSYFQTGVMPTITQKQDPFWDPPQHSLIGKAFITTKTLIYMFDSPSKLQIISQDNHCGQIVVNLIPTDEKGEKNLSQQIQDEQNQFQPESLLGKPFYIKIVVQQATIPQNYEHIYISYKIKNSNNNLQVFMTQQILQRTTNPKFSYSKVHSFQSMTKQLLQYLSTTKIVFRIVGYEMLPEQKRDAIVQKPKQKDAPTEKSKPYIQQTTQYPNINQKQPQKQILMEKQKKSVSSFALQKPIQSKNQSNQKPIEKNVQTVIQRRKTDNVISSPTKKGYISKKEEIAKVKKPSDMKKKNTQQKNDCSIY